MRPGPERTLLEKYLKRISWPLEVKEVDAKGRLEGAALQRAEGKRILALVPAGAQLVALDERGKALSSRAFAELMADWQDRGLADVAFAIGGADGLSEEVRARADHLIAFGPATWPHLLVRVMLAEQLYRAASILAGHPYHRD